MEFDPMRVTWRIRCDNHEESPLINDFILANKEVISKVSQNN